jgi:hypothetical protein
VSKLVLEYFSHPRLPKLHICSLCKRKFVWDEYSRWFGKLEDDNGMENVIARFCSIVCADNSGLE